MPRSASRRAPTKRRKARRPKVRQTTTDEVIDALDAARAKRAALDPHRELREQAASIAHYARLAFHELFPPCKEHPHELFHLKQAACSKMPADFWSEAVAALHPCDNDEHWIHIWCIHPNGITDDEPHGERTVEAGPRRDYAMRGRRGRDRKHSRPPGRRMEARHRTRA